MEEIEALKERIEEIEGRLARLESMPTSSPTSSTKKPQSLREFINEKSPATANDRALTIGYYLESVRKQESFSADGIKRCFREAKIAPPANVNDVINKNIGKGYMMDADDRGGKKAWVLTASGEEVVSTGFKKSKGKE